MDLRAGPVWGFTDSSKPAQCVERAPAGSGTTGCRPEALGDLGQVLPLSLSFLSVKRGDWAERCSKVSSSLNTLIYTQGKTSQGQKENLGVAQRLQLLKGHS